MRRTFVLVSALALCSCAGQQWQATDAYRVAIHAARTVCALVPALPEPVEAPDAGQ